MDRCFVSQFLPIVLRNVPQATIRVNHAGICTVPAEDHFFAPKWKERIEMFVSLFCLNALDKKTNYIYTVYMTRDRRRTNTKRLIGEAAVRLFEKGGVRAVSMRKVATEVGITPMAIYNHFENMEDLLLYIYEKGVRKLSRSIRAAIARRRKPDMKLKALVKSYVRFGLRNQQYYGLLFGTEFIQRYLWDKPPRSLMMVGFWGRLTGAVEDCQQEGLVDRERNAQEIATHLWSSMHGYTCFLIIGRLQQLWQLPEEEFIEIMARNLVGSIN